MKIYQFKKLSLISIASIICYFTSHAQLSTKIQFEDLNPDWQHIVIDSSLLSIYPNGEEMMLDGLSLFTYNNNYVYNINSFYDNHLFRGAYFEKINIETGKIEWENSIYKDKTEKMESVLKLYIAGDHLSILSLRAKVNNWLFNNSNKFSKWVIDTTSGDILNHFYTEYEDATSQVLYSNILAFDNFLLALPNEEYIYASAHSSPSVSDSTDLYLYILNESGILLKDLSLNGLERKYYSNYLRYFKMVTKDIFLIFRNCEEERIGQLDTFHSAYFVDLLDSNFNVKMSKELKGMEYENSINSYIEFLYADKDWIVFKSHIDGKIDKLCFYDYNLKLKNKYDITTPENEYISSPTIEKLKDGSFLLVGTTFSLEQGNNNHLCFFKVTPDSGLDLLKRAKVIPQDHIWINYHTIELDNGDIVLGGKHGYNVFYSNKYSTDGDWHSWIRLKAEDIGLKTYIDDISKFSDLSLSPNPTSDYFTISCEETGNKNVEVLDQLGRLVLKQSIEECGENQVDMSALNSGLYFVRLMDDEGRIVGTGKVVKE